MRISDWSSDVCSSDLTAFTDLFLPADSQGERQRTLPFLLTKQSKFHELPLRSAFEGDDRWWAISGRPQFDGAGKFTGYRGSGTDITEQRRSAEDASRLARSEEHTSELQSLMRISYAVVCLK